MKTRKLNMRLKSIALMMTAVIVLAACNKDETEDMAPAPSPMPADEKNIVETAQSLPQFSILVDAVVKAGLVVPTVRKRLTCNGYGVPSGPTLQTVWVTTDYATGDNCAVDRYEIGGELVVETIDRAMDRLRELRKAVKKRERLGAVLNAFTFAAVAQGQLREAVATYKRLNGGDDQ